MIKAESKGKATRVEVEGKERDLLNEYCAVVEDTFRRSRKDYELLAVLFDATLEAMRRGVGDELEKIGELFNGQSEADNTEPSYEVRIDNLS